MTTQYTSSTIGQPSPGKTGPQMTDSIEDLIRPIQHTPSVPVIDIPDGDLDAPFDFQLFQHTLFDSLGEGVIFVDLQCRIQAWSQAVEQMTGNSSENYLGTLLTPASMNLCDKDGDPVSGVQCPVASSLSMQKIVNSEYRIIGRSGREVKIELTSTPVFDFQNRFRGVVVLLNDTSAQLDLQRQLRDLYEVSVLDPLTQVANRAEFERVLGEAVRAIGKGDASPLSLIICDIDFFKSINDNYGHHIGDQALVSFASQLQKFVRSRDLVARYGGEEFVILCADCDIHAAAERAEELRESLAKTPQQMLNGKCITASFGVSQLRNTDCSTDVFVRGDTALLKAKELGRNRVVIANATASGTAESAELTSVETASLSGVTWRETKGKILVAEEFMTQTPISVLVEKMRGYIFEQEAEIRHVESDFVSMEIDLEDPENPGHRGRFRVLVEFQEIESNDARLAGLRRKTFIHITIREASRKWFSTNSIELWPRVMNDLRRYLMISDQASILKVNSAGHKTAGR